MAQLHNSYFARQEAKGGVPIVRLGDPAREMEVEIVPSLGNRAIALRVRGENFLYVPSDDPTQLKANRHLNGIPFLAPWANRMPDGFGANGKYYRFDSGSAALRLDQNGIPIHGLLTASPLWKVVECATDEHSAHVTSRLQLWKYPEMMANWPFAHEYEMTHRLADGALEVSITVVNLSAEAMPVAIGFHPYFQLPGVPIAESSAHIPVSQHVETDSRLVATGDLRPVQFPEQVSLRDHHFDDGFTGLTGAAFSVEGGGRRIDVRFGPKFQVGVVFAPAEQNYICFEPMTAITNGINLAREGKYTALQSIPAGDDWNESFSVRVL
jgi:aldose 1-epimerase